METSRETYILIKQGTCIDIIRVVNGKKISTYRFPKDRAPKEVVQLLKDRPIYQTDKAPEGLPP